jgi:hypothetical protein
MPQHRRAFHVVIVLVASSSGFPHHCLACRINVGVMGLNVSSVWGQEETLSLWLDFFILSNNEITAHFMMHYLGLPLPGSPLVFPLPIIYPSSKKPAHIPWVRGEAHVGQAEASCLDKQE